MKAKEILERGGYSCVVVQNGVAVDARCGIGVKPVLFILDHHPGDLDGASVADKVIGKAAAMLLTLGGVREIYGAVMSESAVQFLIERRIAFAYGERVPYIENRTRDGVCPIEQSVLRTDDPEEGLLAIRAAIVRLMQQK